MTMLQHNYQMVCSQLADAVQQAGRPSGSVQLVAVSKTFPAEAIREVYAAGQRDFGENYIQEWSTKTEELADLQDIVWHIIGQVQSNKTRVVAERAHWVHSIDKLKTAERLSAQRPPNLPILQVCIEVNIANEANKHGVPPQEAVALALAVSKLPNLQVRGLMCVAEAAAGEAELQRQFQQMLEKARSQGQVQADPELLARWLMNVMKGLRVNAREQMPKEQLQQMINLTFQGDRKSVV